jgi:hypothetical protein
MLRHGFFFFLEYQSTICMFSATFYHLLPFPNMLSVEFFRVMQYALHKRKAVINVKNNMTIDQAYTHVSVAQ